MFALNVCILCVLEQFLSNSLCRLINFYLVDTVTFLLRFTEVIHGLKQVEIGLAFQ